MSTDAAASSVSRPRKDAAHALSTDRARATAAIVAHLVVDLFSFIVVPLLSIIEGRLHLSAGEGTALIAIGSVSSGLIQPIVALLSDRHDTRVIGTLGFLVAVLAVGGVGYVDTYAQLIALQVVATAGVGAFHPVAAAAVGQLAHTRRSLALAWFYAAGMIGGVGGNLLAPAWAGTFGRDALGVFDAAAGLRSLAYLIPLGLLFVGLLVWAVHSTPHRHADAQSRHASLSATERRSRWRAIALLWVGNVLKFGVDTAVIALVKEWTKHLAERRFASPGSSITVTELAFKASSLSGPLQASKQIGMGIGGLLLGFLLVKRYEKHAMIGVPLLGAAALFVLPHTDGATAWVVCAVAGLGYGSTIPLTLSISQRLLPHRTSLASALMLGGAWSIGSFGSTIAQALSDRVSLAAAFDATAIAMVLSALVAVPLAGRLLQHSHEPHAR